MKITRQILTITLLTLTVFSVAGCHKKNVAQAKNMEQIQKEEGVPVRVENVVTHLFAKDLSYNATLSGIAQSNEYSAFDGRVVKVNAKVGDRVQKGQVLVEFPMDLPAAQYSSVLAAYNLSKTTYERMSNLLAKGGISQQDLDQAKAQYDAASDRLDAVNQMLKVRAPITGVVTEMTVKETDNVKAQDPLFTVSRLDHMKATVWVDDTEIADIKKGMDAVCTWSNEEIHGRVSEVAMAMDPARQAFAVDVDLPNSGAKLKAGVLAEIDLRTYVNPKAIVVARKSTRTDEKGTYVFLNDNGVARKTYIEVGKTSDLDLEVTGGLTEGQQVITEGLNLLQDGAKVKVSE